MSEFWNERYRAKDYVYGEEPNVFFKEQIQKLNPGTLILPCEGEGRNAVFAASLGWKILAFDSSESGRVKAMQLAEKMGQSIDYRVADAREVSYPEGSADAVAFIFAHFPPDLRRKIYHQAIGWLKTGGRIILESFNPLQLNNETGGPKDISMLCTEEILKEDFEGLEIEWIQSLKVRLNEGKYHHGLADVVQFVGTKS